MISETGLRALRVAATTAFALPTIRLRIRHGERAILDVRRPDPSGGLPGRSMPPCAFRNAVARAHRLVRDGHQLQFLDLPDGDEPAIDIGLRTGDALLPGGIYRVTFQERWVHAFATTLEPARCQRLAGDDLATTALLGFHWDEATEVTLVHLETRAACPEAATVVHEVLEPFLARCATEELLSQLQLAA
jgi:hypothetical protein